MGMTADENRMEVCYLTGEAYEISVRGHRIQVDQPADDGGEDTAPTPTELFVASLASCVAYYAGRYLSRHGFSRTGLTVSASFEMATDRPARVAGIRIAVKVPTDLPESRWPAFEAVVRHCTVHNTLRNEPEVSVDLV
jgi:putative redox protein